jgi:hypothetical protein
MVVPVKTPSAARRRRARAGIRMPGHGRLARRALAPAVACLAVALAGCGADFDARPAAHVSAASVQPPVSVPASCSTAVLQTLSGVAQRIYHEGVFSERTASAEYLITHSAALRAAAESGDQTAARSAVRSLLSTGHMTNVTVLDGSKTLVRVGGPALAPIHGTLMGANGLPIATYVASVWADEGFLTEAGGITEGLVSLRSHGRSVGGSPPLAGTLAEEGALTRAGVAYVYTSFPAVAYPAGALRVYLLMPTASVAALCGRTAQDTVANTLERVAKLIYEGEIGLSAQAQIRRLQAIDALLVQHVVRIRVTTHGQLLQDVGGPYVLGPVSAPLRLHGHQIGELSLSIQDDEGYLRLARRLAGLDVLMYMDPRSAHPLLVKDSLGPIAAGPALNTVPVSGPYTYEKRPFRVFTVHAEAFPSGPLAIRVFAPVPYLASAKPGSTVGAGPPAPGGRQAGRGTPTPGA